MVIFLIIQLMYISSMTATQTIPATTPQTNESFHHRKAMLARIPPSSLKNLLLFASLYKNTKEGEEALQQAWSILSPTTIFSSSTPQLPYNFHTLIERLLHVIEPSYFHHNQYPSIQKETEAFIEKIGENLHHKSLQGHRAHSLSEILTLPSEEIDISRAVLLLEGEKISHHSTIEASLDLLALEILSTIGKNASSEEKICAINNLLFHERGIRFPPKAQLMAKKSAAFSELSKVLFSKRGVCLGTTIVYLALAQRLNLPLIIYTPPGHIFLGNQQKNAVRVIETTARGVHIPIKNYETLSLRHIPQRSLKEVIGMVLFNKAGSCLQNKNFEQAVSYYQQAANFYQDYELQQMTAFALLLTTSKKQAAKYAKNIQLPTYRLEHDTFVLDIQSQTLSQDDASTLLNFLNIEKTTVLTAIKALQERASSQSLSIPLHLAHCWLEFGKPKEAISILENLTQNPRIPYSTHCLLATLYQERMNIEKTWEALLLALQATEQFGMIPKKLETMIIELQISHPCSHKLSLFEQLITKNKKEPCSEKTRSR